MCGELSLGQDVCHSPGHGLHVCWVLSIKQKVDIESTLEKKEVLNVCVCLDKISIVISQTRQTF